MTLAEKLTTVVSTKGQVILPKAIRENRDWPAGTRLVVEDTAEGVLLSPAPQFSATTSDQVFASLPFIGTPKSVEAMDAGVMAEARRQNARD